MKTFECGQITAYCLAITELQEMLLRQVEDSLPEMYDGTIEHVEGLVSHLKRNCDSIQYRIDEYVDGRTE